MDYICIDYVLIILSDISSQKIDTTIKIITQLLL